MQKEALKIPAWIVIVTGCFSAGISFAVAAYSAFPTKDRVDRLDRRLERIENKVDKILLKSQ